MHHTEILLSVSIVTFSPSSVYDSAPAYQILYELDQRQSYDVISRHTVANLVSFSSMVIMCHVSEGTKQCYFSCSFSVSVSVKVFDYTIFQLILSFSYYFSVFISVTIIIFQFQFQLLT